MLALEVIRQESPAQCQNINGLFFDFVKFIDRGERTTGNALANLRQFAAFMKYKGITQPTREDIIVYREWLSAEHEAVTLDAGTARGVSIRTDRNGNTQRVTCKPSTVRAYLQTVKQFFTWTAASGLYPNIAANIHAPKITEAHKKDSLTAEEVREIEESITREAQEKQKEAAAHRKDRAGRISRATEQGKRLYAIYLLAVNAGLRTVEISRAKVSDVQTRNGKAFIMIWGKGHAEADQKKPLAPEVAEAIRDYLKTRTDRPTAASPLFVATGNRNRGGRIAETTISTMLKRALQAAGFDSPRLTAHSLRHTTGENVMELTGKNIYQTQQYMRHANPKTTEIYLDNEAAAQDDSIAIRLFDRYHGRRSEDSGRQKLLDAIDRLNREQIDSLATLAAAMAI